MKNIKSNFIENIFSSYLINEVIKTYLNHKCSSNQNQLKDTSGVYYFKLPYIDKLLHHIKNKLWKLWKEFCIEDFIIRLVFNSFNVCINSLVLAVVLATFYLFIYIHFSYSKTRIEGHIRKDNKLHNFKHLHLTTT